MTTDQRNRHTPADPEAAFLAEMDAMVSDRPAPDGSALLATARHVRDLAASDLEAQLDPARQQEIWRRVMAGRHTTSTASRITGRLTQATERRVLRPAAPLVSQGRTWRPGGWLATAITLCLLAALAVPLARELGRQGQANVPTQMAAQTRTAALGASGGDNLAGNGQLMTPQTSVNAGQGLTPAAAGAGQAATLPPAAPTQAVPPADQGLLAPPSTVIATMPANLTVGARVSVADPHQLLFQLEQNGNSYNWEDRRRTDPSGKSPYSAIPWTWSRFHGVAIVQQGQADEPLAGYIVFDRPEEAAQQLAEMTQAAGLVSEKTRVDQYDGVIVFNNDRVSTIVQVGNVLVIGNAWTGANDWMSSEIDLQPFKWQSLRQTVSAIAYLDRVVSAYQGHR